MPLVACIAALWGKGRGEGEGGKRREKEGGEGQINDLMYRVVTRNGRYLYVGRSALREISRCKTMTSGASAQGAI